MTLDTVVLLLALLSLPLIALIWRGWFLPDFRAWRARRRIRAAVRRLARYRREHERRL